MRLASLAFFLILAGLHGSEGTLAQPLSTFRDGPHRTWGFALFSLLTFIGLKWIWTLIRTRSASELVGVVPALPLLGFVALIDSRDGWHLAASFALLGWVLLFFAAKLWEEENWLVFFAFADADRHRADDPISQLRSVAEVAHRLFRGAHQHARPAPAVRARNKTAPTSRPNSGL